MNVIRIHNTDKTEKSYVKYPKEIDEFIIKSDNEVSKLSNYETTLISTQHETIKIPKSTFLKNGYNELKGWHCEIKALIIHYDAYVSYACKNKKTHILTCDFKTDGLICPYNLCECDDYWSFEKVNNESK